MNIKNAKSFIRSNQAVPFELFSCIIDGLSRIYSTCSNEISYEFSLNNRDSEVGFQYEPKYNLNKPIQLFEIAKKDSFLFIYNLLNSLNNYHKAKFNLEKIRKVLAVAFGSPFLFIHYGFEVYKKKIRKIKIYFIPDHNIVHNVRTRPSLEIFVRQLERVSLALGLRGRKFISLLDSQLNAFAVDFLTDSSFTLKIYKTYLPAQDSGRNNICYSRKKLWHFLEPGEIKDIDLMYSISRKGSLTNSLVKVYFYPKPTVKIRNIAMAKRQNILNKFQRSFSGGYLSKLSSAEIYAVSAEAKNLLNIYIR